MNVAATVICALTNLTDLPGITFQEMYFAPTTPDRVLCGPVRDNEVLFYLYTRNTRNSPAQLKLNDDTLLERAKVDFKKPSIIFFHGFLESYKSKDAQEVKDAYLQREDCNVILVDAKVLYAGLNYITAARNVEAVGKYSAKFIDYLVSKGLDLESFEVIGMSLGGQTTGIVGKNVKSGTINKIVAYDPAGPLFTILPKDQKLGPTDAKQVIVIHTSPLQFGYPDSVGTTDIWVNGYTLVQPGCLPVSAIIRNLGNVGELVFCSHWLSYRLAVYAVNHPKAFPGAKCADKGDLLAKKCDGEKIFLGDEVPTSATGDYLVEVNSGVYKYVGKL